MAAEADYALALVVPDDPYETDAESLTLPEFTKLWLQGDRRTDKLRDWSGDRSGFAAFREELF